MVTLVNWRSLPHILTLSVVLKLSVGTSQRHVLELLLPTFRRPAYRQGSRPNGLGVSLYVATYVKVFLQVGLPFSYECSCGEFMVCRVVECNSELLYNYIEG